MKKKGIDPEVLACKRALKLHLQFIETIEERLDDLSPVVERLSEVQHSKEASLPVSPAKPLGLLEAFSALQAEIETIETDRRELARLRADAGRDKELRAWEARQSVADYAVMHSEELPDLLKGLEKVLYSMFAQGQTARIVLRKQ